MKYKSKAYVSFLRKDAIIKNIEIAVTCIVAVTVIAGIYSVL